MTEERIGTYTLTETTTFRKGYEVASWYSMIEVPPGEYPVYVTRSMEGFVQFVLVPMDGTITEESTPSLFGGVAYGKGNGDANVGKPGQYTIQTYLFMVEDDDRYDIEVERRITA